MKAPPTSPKYDQEWQRELGRRLRHERGAGTIPARVDPVPLGVKGDVRAAERVRAAAEVLPASWVDRANLVGAFATRRTMSGGLGSYSRPGSWSTNQPLHVIDSQANALIGTQAKAGLSTALHEYTHHLQYTMPELDGLFHRVHVRRTTRPDGSRDPMQTLQGYKVPGREDRYIDRYFGREYPASGGSPGGPREVITRTYQVLFHSIGKGQTKMSMGTLRDKDPELLDFALGTLFRYDPP